MAGITFEKGRPSPAIAHPEWLSARQDERYVLTRHDGWERLWSYRYPESLLVATTFEAQASELSRWVVERFSGLAATLPANGEPDRI